MQYQTFNTRLKRLMFTEEAPDLDVATKRAINNAKLHGLDPSECFTCAAVQPIVSAELDRYGIVWAAGSDTFMA